jgi:hypothetical protein
MLGMGRPFQRKDSDLPQFDLIEACRLATPKCLERLLVLVETSANDAAVARAAESIIAYGFGRPQMNLRVEKADDGGGERLKLIDHLAEHHPEALRSMLKKVRLIDGAAVTSDDGQRKAFSALFDEKP